jgi:hypothetical protein
MKTLPILQHFTVLGFGCLLLGGYTPLEYGLRVRLIRARELMTGGFCEGKTYQTLKTS